jgi:hypothetical protein
VEGNFDIIKMSKKVLQSVSGLLLKTVGNGSIKLHDFEIYKLVAKQPDHPTSLA